MSGYTPIEPGAPSKKSGVSGCLVGCLIAAAAAVAIVLAVGTFVGWKLTRPNPPAPDVTLRDGTETMYVHARLEPDDPGLGALAASFAAAARDIARARPGAPPMIDVPRAQARLDALPADFDVVRRARGDGSDALVGAVRFEGRPKTVRAVFRVAAFFAPAEGTSGLRRIDRDGRTTLVVEKTVGNPGAPELAVTMVGDRIVGARDLETLEAALAAVAESGAADEPSSLAGEVRLEAETGWGYVRPHAAAAAGAVRLAVVSFKLVGEDLVRWRAALRSDDAPKDKDASAQAFVAWLAGIPLPGSMKVTLDRTTRWLDDRTLVVEGTVDGIQRAARAIFEARSAGVTDAPTPAPGTEPASPSR